jgi:uncharacterized protein (DUF952 family)
MKIILHITTYDAWARARTEGVYAPESLKTDGFIHCSAVTRVIDVADNFYTGQKDLLLVCIDKEKLTSRLKYEPPVHPGTYEASPSDTIDLFPHLYGPLNLDAVVMVVEFPPNDDGTFELPRMVADIT